MRRVFSAVRPAYVRARHAVRTARFDFGYGGLPAPVDRNPRP